MGVLGWIRKSGHELPGPANYSSEVEKWLSPDWQQAQGAVRAGLPSLQALVSGKAVPGSEEYLKGAERNYQTSRNRLMASNAAAMGGGGGGFSGVGQSYAGNTELARGEQMSRARLEHEQAMAERLNALLLPLMNQQNQLYNTALGKTTIRRKGKRNLLKALAGVVKMVGGAYGGGGAMLGSGAEDFASGIQREDIIEGAGGGPTTWSDSSGGGGMDWSGLGDAFLSFKGKKKQPHPIGPDDGY